VERDLARIGSTRYDLLVVGGGIHGLFTAYDAASRGLSVLLLERRDFGSGLSFNHQRTIHGGLRALESGQITKTQVQVAERRTWAVIAPHLIRPLPFLIGTYHFSKRSRLLVGAGFRLYNALSRDRNEDLPEALHLPASQLVPASEVIGSFPGVRSRGLSGGAVWFDYQARHPDRLNWAVALAARAAGAELGNYFEVVGPGGKDAQAGIRVRDALDGGEVMVQCRAVVLATGSWVSQSLLAFGSTESRPLLRAMNILVARPASDISLAAPGRSGRMLTAVPWHDLTLIGTHQSERTFTTGDGRATAAELDALIDDANVAFPSFKITRDDIRVLHQGLTPAIVKGGRARLQPESEVLRVTTARQPVFAVVGVKFTTARQTAERVVDLVSESLHARVTAPSTATSRLPHAGLISERERAQFLNTQRERVDAEVMAHLLDWYGTEAPTVWSLAHSLGLTWRLAPDTPVIAGEVAYAVRSAQAVTLADVVLRRTMLGAAGHPGRRALDQAAGVMEGLLEWSPEDRVREVAAVEEVYRLPS
jgi:glycerol-3-phosphate dehydrogenase